MTVLGQTAIKDLISKTKDPSQIKQLEQYYKAYGAIGNNKTGKFGLSGYQFDALAKLSGGAIFRPTKDQLKEGMVIGQNVSAGGWGQRGIDHIAQVVRHPKTGELVIAESNGSDFNVSDIPAILLCSVRLFPFSSNISPITSTPFLSPVAG